MTGQIRKPGEITDLAEPVVTSQKNNSMQSEDFGSINLRGDRTVGVVKEEAESFTDHEELHDIEQQAVSLKKIRSPWSLLFSSSAVLFLCWTAYDYSTFVTEVYHSSIFVGLLLALLGILLLVSLIFLIIYEYKAWKSFDDLAHRNHVIDTALKNIDLQLTKDALSDTLSNIKALNPDLVSQFEDASLVNTTPEEYLIQLENIVLIPLDIQADTIIKKSAMAAGVSVSVIPHPALDAIAVTWYSYILSKKIAAIYGVRPSGLSSIRLFKYILSNAVIAAGAEVASAAIGDGVAQSATESAGEILFGSLFSKVGEGAVTVWRLYRLGRIVRLAIRPNI
jgi:putative membrane protein